MAALDQLRIDRVQMDTETIVVFLINGALELLKKTLGQWDDEQVALELGHDFEGRKRRFHQCPALIAALHGHVRVVEWFFTRYPDTPPARLPVRITHPHMIRTQVTCVVHSYLSKLAKVTTKTWHDSCYNINQKN